MQYVLTYWFSVYLYSSGCTGVVQSSCKYQYGLQFRLKYSFLALQLHIYQTLGIYRFFNNTAFNKISLYDLINTFFVVIEISRNVIAISKFGFANRALS